jgi:hypothetical protein
MLQQPALCWGGCRRLRHRAQGPRFTKPWGSCAGALCTLSGGQGIRPVVNVKSGAVCDTVTHVVHSFIHSCYT